jgi:hypothetical protein
MKNLGRKLFLLILLFNLLAYFALIIYGLLDFPAETVLKVYLWPWTISNALAGMTDTFIPVTVTAVLLGFSFFFVPRDKRSGGLSFSTVVSSSVALFLFLVAVYTVLAEGIAPGARVRAEEMKGNSSFAEGSLEEAERLAARGEYGDALLYFDYYISIDPQNDEVRDLREEAAAALELDEGDEESEEEPGRGGRLLDQNAGDLIQAAREFLARRDYYSAHYYATIASKLDPARDDAKRIASEAWNRISEAEFSREASAMGDLYSRKKAAYEELNRGNVVRAYYLFRDLAEEYPMDPDVRTFGREALDRLKRESFFIDELEHANQIPGRHRVFFVNRRDENLRELVYFERMVPLGRLAYVYGVEIMGISPSGKPLYHLATPAGKIMEGSDGGILMLKSVDREREGVVYAPEFYTGEANFSTANILKIIPPIQILPGFSLTESSLRLQRINELLALRPGYALRGFHAGALEIELVMRLMRPFGLLIFCYLSIALGWMLRLRGPRRWYHLLLLPVVPMVIFLAADLYLYGSRLIYLYFVLQAGFLLTIIFMVLIQALLLGASLILVAGQSTHEAS